MKIVIIGDGKVGRAITEHISQEGHEIVVIDKNPHNIEKLIDTYDVMGICGNGASYDIQVEARVQEADLLIAATSMDEVNIFSCVLAKKLGAKDTIARVRNPEYHSQVQFMKDALGISMIINPEYETAMEIVRMIDFPGALKVEKFAGGKVELIEGIIEDKSPLVGQTLLNIRNKYQIQILVCAVQRENEVFIPTGNFVLQAKDKIHLAARRENLLAFFAAVGADQEKIDNIMIIGGGKIAYYLIDELLKSRYHVKVIEYDEARCHELSELFPKAAIIHADGTDQDILKEEGSNSAGAIISLTNIDEENMVISMYAQQCGINKIILKINRNSLAQMIQSVRVASVIAPKDVTANQVLSYVRAKANNRGSKVVTLYKLVNNLVEALEFEINESALIINIPLKDLHVRENILIACIIRNGEVIVPNGEDVIKLNDNVIVVTANAHLEDINEIRG